MKKCGLGLGRYFELKADILIYSFRRVFYSLKFDLIGLNLIKVTIFSLIVQFSNQYWIEIKIPIF